MTLFEQNLSRLLWIMSEDPIAWWKEHLEGASSIQLPTDYARPLNKAHVEREEVLEPSPAICKRILRLSLDIDATPFTVVLGIFLIALHKYSLEEDIVVGSSSSSTNAQVLRLAIGGDMTFRDVLAAVQREEQLAEDHEVDFATLNASVRKQEDDAALCQVRFFNMADVRQETLEAVGACDWSVFIEQKPDAKRILPLRIRVSYNALLFSQERMAEFLNQIQFVTEAITGNSEILVDDISIVTELAKAGLPDPSVALDDTFHGSIASVFAERAAQFPDRPFIFEDNGARMFTYREVDALASQVANFLLESAKIQPEDAVAIYAHRSAPLVVAVMGVLRAGATVCIIDPQYPAKRQIVYLEVARPKALVVLESAGNLLPEVKEHLEKTPEIRSLLRGLNMDSSTNSQLAQVSTAVPTQVNIGPEHIATLSFTSGSTGIPKGCRGRAISLTHFYPWMGQEFNLTETDRFTMLSGIAHDPIQRDIFTPIFFGASIHIPSREEILEPGRLAEWCARNQVTITVLTPAMGQLLTADATAQIPTLKHAFFVGDVLAKRDVIRLQQLSPDIKVVNMMGSTETQRAVSFLTIANDSTMMERKEILPAGRGMKDVQLLVLNNRMKICGIGEVGEIFIRSPHIAAGYLGRDEETQAKFLPNPFVEDADRKATDRIYKTGDTGRYLPSGIVECMGRRDDQVKIRGFRVELREIDTFLQQHPSVREAVTMLRRDVNEEKRLVNYFVPMEANQYDVEVLRSHLREKLPAYAIPSDFVPLVRFPLNPNGKIDKGRLPFPDTVQSHMLKQQQQANSDSSTPLTPLQKVLHQVWSDALGRQTVALTDNFFDLGGHSVLATRVIFKMRQALQTELPLNLLYDHPTIEGLSGAIEESKGDATAMIVTDGIGGGQRKEPEKLCLASKVVLDDEITLKDGPFVFPSTIKVVFLTGATGFLGSFLLHDLLMSQVEAKVYCLARAPSDEEALARLEKTLRAHYLWKDLFAGRIVGLAGDLGKAHFGLADELWNMLAAQVDVIIHNGALVHWVFPYAQLAGPNVSGTVEALRLASSGGKIKPMHFVSSTSVFDTEHYVSMDLVMEDDSLDAAAEHLSSGYAQTKWVSEKIVMLARSRGLPVTITRPGYIVGSSNSGVCQSDDFLLRLLRGCIELKKAPHMLNRLNCCSVDYVSGLIVKIASSPEATGRAYHTYNPSLFRFDDYFAIAAAFGWDLELVEYMDWRAQLKDLTLTSNDSALYPLLHFVLDDLPTKSHAPRLDNSNSMSFSSLSCMPMAKLMPKMLAYLVKTEYLSKPVRAGALTLPELPMKDSDIVKMDARSRETTK